MKFALSLLFVGAFAFAQSPSNYLNDRNESHLCGPFQIEAIEKDSLYMRHGSKKTMLQWKLLQAFLNG